MYERGRRNTELPEDLRLLSKRFSATASYHAYSGLAAQETIRAFLKKSLFEYTIPKFLMRDRNLLDTLH